MGLGFFETESPPGDVLAGMKLACSDLGRLWPGPYIGWTRGLAGSRLRG